MSVILTIQSTTFKEATAKKDDMLILISLFLVPEDDQS